MRPLPGFDPCEPPPLPRADGVTRAAALFEADLLGAPEADRDDIPAPEILARAVPRRRASYVAGRLCARQALRELGWDGPAPEMGADRLPVWPPGYLGSITHTHGFAWAVAARAGTFAGLGVDSEEILEAERAANLHTAIATPEEWARRARWGLEDRIWLTLVFSAKESLFKCLYPIVRKFFYFQHAAIDEIDVAAGRFRWRLLIDLDPGHVTGMMSWGSFCMDERRVHTSVVS